MCAPKKAERGESGTCWLVESWERNGESCLRASGPAVTNDMLTYAQFTIPASLAQRRLCTCYSNGRV